MENVKVCFKSKSPHANAWIHMEFSADEEPISLLDALLLVDWKENPNGLSVRVSPCNGVQEISVMPPKGSGLFNSLTPAEWVFALRDAEMVLRDFGWDTQKIPHYKLTAQDCL